MVFSSDAAVISHMVSVPNFRSRFKQHERQSRKRDSAPGAGPSEVLPLRLAGGDAEGGPGEPQMRARRGESQIQEPKRAMNWTKLKNEEKNNSKFDAEQVLKNHEKSMQIWSYVLLLFEEVFSEKTFFFFENGACTETIWFLV